MALTTAHVVALAMMAGANYEWQGCSSSEPTGSRRNGGSVKVGMRLWLWEAQGRMCPTCGEGISSPLTSDLAHVVGRGTRKRGFVAGNIYLSHPSCNVGVARQEWEFAGEVKRSEFRINKGIAEYAAAEFTVTLSNEAGYQLTLMPEDFKRADIIPTEWPGATVGYFIYFDPDFQGKRKA